ncbi:MAG TPA: hypothetical protein DCL65_01690, partial [Chryseobacterium sp.]|nr:hypothetical protein [Chryseobacterium sp.]
MSTVSSTSKKGLEKIRGKDLLIIVIKVITVVARIHLADVWMVFFLDKPKNMKPLISLGFQKLHKFRRFFSPKFDDKKWFMGFYK